MKVPPHALLAGIESSVAHALATGNVDALDVLAYGEISTVLRLESPEGTFAIKRLPPFSSADAVERYRVVFRQYLDALAASGVRVVDSEVLAAERANGMGLYCVQPLLPRAALLELHLQSIDAREAVVVFNMLLDRILGSVGPRLGIDGQLPNWVWVDGEPQFLDVTTPMLRDDDGREQLDIDMFLASLPWLIRGLVKRFTIKDILDKYYQPRGVVLDLLGNLYKSRLDHLLPAFIAEANKRIQPAFTELEVWRYYVSDAKTWSLLLRLRRMDRWWQRAVRRRAYPFLLPGHIARNRPPRPVEQRGNT